MHAGLVKLHARKHTLAPVHSPIRQRACARGQTHIQNYEILIAFSTPTLVSSRASILRYAIWPLLLKHLYVSTLHFLRAFAKLRKKKALRFVMSVCPSVLLPHTRLPLDKLHEILHLRIFLKSVEKIQL